MLSSFICKMKCLPTMQKHFKHKNKLSQKWMLLGFYQRQKSRAEAIVINISVKYSRCKDQQQRDAQGRLKT